MIDEYDEYRVIYQNLPVSIRGFCFHDDDGRITVVLNARLTRELNRASIAHEITHILRDDLDDPGYIEYPTDE